MEGIDSTVQLDTADVRVRLNNHTMLKKQLKVNTAVDELRSQGLSVTTHSPSNRTWYIKGEGIYLEEQDTAKGGIIIPDTAKEKS